MQSSHGWCAVGDDIVTRLRAIYSVYGPMDEMFLAVLAAADEIERLRRIIKRVVAAGDDLADELGRKYNPDAGDALLLWQEARRG